MERSQSQGGLLQNLEPAKAKAIELGCFVCRWLLVHLELRLPFASRFPTCFLLLPLSGKTVMLHSSWSGNATAPLQPAVWFIVHLFRIRQRFPENKVEPLITIWSRTLSSTRTRVRSLVRLCVLCVFIFSLADNKNCPPLARYVSTFCSYWHVLLYANWKTWAAFSRAKKRRDGNGDGCLT